MNYGGFILGCITVILILLIVCAFIYPNTIYDSSIILLTAISSIAWIIVYMSTRTLRCIQNDNPKELICKIGGNGRKYKIKGGIKGGISNQERIIIKTILSDMFKKNIVIEDNKLKYIYDDIMKRLNSDLDCANQQDSSEFVQIIIDNVFDKGNIMENANYFSDLSTKQSPIDINADYTWDNKCKLKENTIIDKELVDLIFYALRDSIKSKHITRNDIDSKNIDKISKIIIGNDNIQKNVNLFLNKILQEQKLNCTGITDIFITLIIRRIIDNYGFFSPLFNESFYIMNVQSTIYMNTQPDNNYKKLLEEIVLRKSYIPEFNNYQLVAFNELRGKSNQGVFINSNRIINAGHYVTYVLRNIKGKLAVYECNDAIITHLSGYTSLEGLMESKTTDKNIRTTMLLFANKNNIKTDTPTGLKNFTGNACFVNSGMQLLLSTDLFDNNTIDSNSQNAQDTIEVDTKAENTERAKTSISTKTTKALALIPTPTTPSTTAPTTPAETSTPVPAPVPISATNNVTSKIGNINIEIIIGDIFDTKADAIVNPANIQLYNAGGLAEQIHKKSTLHNDNTNLLNILSKQLQYKENKDLFETGDAIVTDASSPEWESLRFTSIIHTPGPDFRKPAGFGAESYADKIDTGKEKLKDCMFNIMDQANKNEVVTDIKDNKFIKKLNQNPITSISIPMISSAIFAGKLNKEDLHKSIGKKYIEGILKYLNTNLSIQNITKINFVIYDDKNNPSNSKSYFNNFVQGFNEGIDEYNKKKLTPTSVDTQQQQQNKQPAPAETTTSTKTEEAPAETTTSTKTEEAPATPVPAPAQPQPQPQAQTDEQNWEKLQKEDQSRSNLNRDLSDNSTENNKPKDYDVYKQNLEESEQNKKDRKEVKKEDQKKAQEAAAKKAVQQALNTAAKTAKNIVPQILNATTQKVAQAKKAKEDDEYEDYEDDFEISDPYTSYSSSYSSDSIKKISKRYGTDTTSFDKFYKELLHSEIS